jgi:enamine deaminase RidA (YjgF/YER057c/UK114 family)
MNGAPLQTPEQRLAAAGWTLPPPAIPRGHYAPYHRHAVAGVHWVAISGQTSRIQGQPLAGRCEPHSDLEPALHAARIAALNSLAALQAVCGGELQCVQQLVRLRGFIRASDDFGAHPRVLDAASQVLGTAFPELELPARSALGVGSLPDGVWVELELDAIVSPL